MPVHSERREKALLIDLQGWDGSSENVLVLEVRQLPSEQDRASRLRPPSMTLLNLLPTQDQANTEDSMALPVWSSWSLSSPGDAFLPSTQLPPVCLQSLSQTHVFKCLAYLLIIFHVNWCFACMCIWVPCACVVPVKARRGRSVPRSWSYGCL